MSDSGSRVKQFTEEVEQATNEVAKDVKDSVGEAIEQGIQSVTGTPLTPQQINNLRIAEQAKQQDDQKKLVQARKTIKWYQDVASSQKRVRDEEKQKQLQKQQSEESEKQQEKLKEKEEKKRVILSPAKKAPQVPGQPQPVPEEIARSKQEVGKGHGIGG